MTKVILVETLSIMKRIVRKVQRSLVFSLNHFLKNYEDVTWLIGDGRSGTTWVSNLIDNKKQYRVLFEPYHPLFTERLRNSPSNIYLAPGTQSPPISKFSKIVFSGKFENPRPVIQNKLILYKGILVKDIYANLLAYWVFKQYPGIKPILLIRNPFAVALSKSKRKDWYWPSEPLDLLKQKELYDDYLSPFEKIIKETSEKKNFILNQILIWCILNYVPLRQFHSDDLYICFYEEIYNNPVHEIGKIYTFIKGSEASIQLEISDEYIATPSRVSGPESNILNGKSPITSWQSELSPLQIKEGIRILKCFGFDHLYDEKSRPDRTVIDAIQNLV
jgi:Sulfotransferase domain